MNILTAAAISVGSVLAMFLTLSALGMRWMKRDALKSKRDEIQRVLSNLTREQVLYAGQFDEDLGTKLLESMGIICKTVNVNIASIGTGAAGVGTVTVAGLTPAHRCIVQAQAALSVAIAITGGRCATAGTLTVDAVNPSAGTLDAAAVNMTLFAIPGDLN